MRTALELLFIFAAGIRRRPAALIGIVLVITPLPVPAGETPAPAGFVDLAVAVPGIVVDVKYATKDNFVGERLDGYEANRAWGVSEMVPDLKRAVAEFRSRGYGVKVFDVYRPLSAEWHMIRWALARGRRDLLGVYVPGSVTPMARFGHVCGNMIDLTLTDARGRELDMGTPFDDFTAAAHTANATGTVRANRQLLVTVLAKYGFKNYAGEWWHFTYTKKEHEALNVPVR